MRSLLVFDTHPIQYRSPVFRSLPPDAQVVFFDRGFDADRWWFGERGTAKALEWGTDLTSGFPHQFLDLADKPQPTRTAAIYRLLEQEKPRAIAIFGYYLPEHWMLRVAAARLKIPLIFIGETYEAGSTSYQRRLLKQVALRIFFRGVHRFISIGDRNREYYLRQGITSDRIIEAKYCVDNQFFFAEPNKARELRRVWREELGIPADRKVALFVGRLFDRKRPRDLLQVHRRLRESMELTTVLAGSGPLEAELRDEAKDLCDFKILGFQNQHQLRAAYYGADVLVVPSEFETWGLVVNEAFACGLPALVTDRCGCAGDLVRPTMTGDVYASGNLEVLQTKLARILREDMDRHSMGQRARELVERHFTPSRFARAMELAAG